MKVQIDFDGTLTSGISARIHELPPNQNMIELVQELFADDNHIVICTARGSKSGLTIEERIAKYQDDIEDWLYENDCPYHEVSFVKEYADIYIDDRAFNAKDLVSYEKLDAGFTENKVRRFNNQVIKRTKSAQLEHAWYVYANRIGINTPTVLHCDIDTITMEHIDGVYCDSYRLSNEILLKMGRKQGISDASFGDYIANIERHLSNRHWNGTGVSEKIIGMLQDVEIPATFNHGDFSVSNLLQIGNDVYAIDPIFRNDVFQSIYIDIAKNLFSILFYLKDAKHYQEAKEFYSKEHGIDDKTLRVLIASESIRVSSYQKRYVDISCNLVTAL
jgi:hypothetical protein